MQFITFQPLKKILRKEKGVFMFVDVPTKVIPIWFIEKWKKENAESGSPLDEYIKMMLKEWELEEIEQSK